MVSAAETLVKPLKLVVVLVSVLVQNLETTESHLAKGLKPRDMHLTPKLHLIKRILLRRTVEVVSKMLHRGKV